MHADTNQQRSASLLVLPPPYEPEDCPRKTEFCFGRELLKRVI